MAAKRLREYAAAAAAAGLTAMLSLGSMQDRAAKEIFPLWGYQNDMYYYGEETTLQRKNWYESLGQLLPILVYGEKSEKTQDNREKIVGEKKEETAGGEIGEKVTIPEQMTLAEILAAEGADEGEWQSQITQNDMQEQAVLPEGWESKAANRGNPQAFVRHEEKLSYIDMNALADYETLVKSFYTVDKSTMVGSDRLHAARMAAQDLSVSGEEPGPQILIYHTHSQEAFADSAPGDPATSIVGAGAYLAQLLGEEYGYEVLHHTASFDLPSRDDAYSVALPEIEKLLEEYPQIQVVIDLHRDAVDEDTRLVTELDGRPTARFMFFNGLSYTRTTGNISYLYNENLNTNLAFSFQMQKAAMEYYPGLTRKIYLKAYRYNMHLCPRTLLVELGAQNNTFEEAKNACEPLAHILDLVLSGSAD